MIKGVSAIVVTRGDIDISPIMDDLCRNYEDVVVWDNRLEPVDKSVFGRYMATGLCRNDLVYFQDDDILFDRHQDLIAEWQQYGTMDNMLCNMDPAWVDRGGYHDIGLLGMGGIMSRFAWEDSVVKYLSHYPEDKFFLDWCDFAVGILTPHLKIDLGYEVRDVAHSGKRLAHGLGNRARKNAMIERARRLRDS